MVPCKRPIGAKSEYYFVSKAIRPTAHIKNKEAGRRACFFVFDMHLLFLRRGFLLRGRAAAFDESGVLGGYFFQPVIFHARDWAAFLLGAARDINAPFG